MTHRSRLVPVLVWCALLLLPPAAAAFHAPPWDTGHQSFQPDNGDNGTNPGNGPGCNNCPCTSQGMSPVEAATGNFTHRLRTVSLAGIGPAIDLTLTYNSRDLRRGAFGVGWVHPYDQRILETTDGVNVYAICSQPNGKRERFLRTADGSYAPPAYVFQTLSKATDGSFSLRDKFGLVRRFSADGRLAAIRDRNGNMLTFSYDATGFMNEVRDSAGRSVQFVKGGDGKIAGMTDSAGRTIGFSYDAAGNLIAYRDPMGSTTTFQYDTANNLTTMVDPRGNTLLRLAYDTAGRVRQHTDGATVWTYTYTPASKRTTKRDSQNRTWTVDYNDNGNITRIVDPLGRIETYVLDASMNVLQYTDTNGNTTQYTYDGLANQLTMTDAAGATRRMTYDPQFNLPRTIEDGLGHITQFEYDDQHGNAVRAIDALGHATRFTYDSRGLVTQVIDPLAQTTTFTYDAHGNLVQTTDPLGNTRSATFDAAGRIETATDAEGRTIQFRYDEADRLTGSVDALAGTTVNEYDASGNLIEVTAANGTTTTYAYDALNRRVQETNGLGQTITYGYDLRSNVTSRRDPNGQTVTFGYDVLDRLISRGRPGDPVSYTYDAVGNMLTVTDADSSVTFVYDTVNRMIETRTASTVGQPATTLRYSYDANGSRLGVSDPAGPLVNYVYDAARQMTAITDAQGGRFAFTYDAAARRTGVTRPLGLATTYDYDAASRLTSLVHTGAPGPLSFSYSYDRVGNRLIKSDPAGIHSYTYDELHRLARVLPPLGIHEERYGYDPSGNRLTSHLSPAYTHNQAGRLTSDATNDYAYDANGNLTRKTERATGRITSHAYDADNQLVRIDFPDGTNATYRYDGLGRRISKTMGTQITRYVYDGQEILLEYAGSVLAARYVNGPGTDEILAVYRGSNAAYAQTDALGSVIRTVAASGEVNQYQYDSFGRILAQGATPMLPHAFTGREYDAESGLYYYRARHYDPATGRFISEDPNGIAAGMNLYAYAVNNPVRLVDPTGEWIWVAAGAVIGAAVNVGVTYVANGGNVTGQQLAAAAVSGAIAGAVGAVAGPLGGTLARGLGASSNGLAAAVGAAGLSAAGSAAGQAAANAIDPCHATSPLNAALWGGVGGGFAKYAFPTKNLNTWAQAQHFGPRTFGGLFGSSNAGLNMGSFGTSSGVGAASNFPVTNPFPNP